MRVTPRVLVPNITMKAEASTFQVRMIVLMSRIAGKKGLKGKLRAAKGYVPHEVGPFETRPAHIKTHSELK
jgi:hypothetical protein